MLNEAEAAAQLKANGTTVEKVDQALSVCCEWVRDETGEFRKDCYRCCYWDENDKATLVCPERLMKDAREVIRELRAEKARVLTLQEIKVYQGAVWIEMRGSDYLEPAVYRYQQDYLYRFSGKDHAFGLDLTIGSYMEEWLAWTIYPTTEERKEVKWKC